MPDWGQTGVTTKKCGEKNWVSELEWDGPFSMVVTAGFDSELVFLRVV